MQTKPGSQWKRFTAGIGRVWSSLQSLAGLLLRRQSTWTRTTAGPSASLAPQPGAVRAVRRALKHSLNDPATGAGRTSLTNMPSTAEREELVSRIRRQTAQANRSNVTRTAAYLRMFKAHPELHWAFLAHMVSRNGGWNMTDLKGEPYSRIFTVQQQTDMFRFLERCNALIFQDAYPQLLLYEESRKQGRPLFELLPELHISRFMEPVWTWFWNEGDSVLLTEALIVNEQHYIEGRVVRNPHYKEHVLETFTFHLQSLLQLNQVVFPYVERTGGIRLAGLTLERFNRLHERIEFGKTLYAILFGQEEVLRGARRFAERTPHTGSRADYAPQLFTADRKGTEAAAKGVYRAKLDGFALRPDASPFYSPTLADAWDDQPMEEVERYDWFCGLDVVDYLKRVQAPSAFDMTTESLYRLSQVELAVVTAEAFR